MLSNLRLRQCDLPGWTGALPTVRRMLVKDAEHDPVVEAMRLHLRPGKACGSMRATVNIIAGNGDQTNRH